MAMVEPPEGVDILFEDLHEPTAEELSTYAKYLGMVPGIHDEFYWIARKGLTVRAEVVGPTPG